MIRHSKKLVWCALVAASTLWYGTSTSFADPSLKYYEQDYLFPDDPVYDIEDDDTYIHFNFGVAMAMDGNVAIFGDTRDVAAAGGPWAPANSITFFRWENGVWGSPQTISKDPITVNNYFGGAVDVSGNYAVVGSIFDDDVAADAGAAFVYKYNTTTGLWEEVQKLKASATPVGARAGDRYGCAVSIDGDTIVIGARSNDQAVTNGGRVYVYARNTTTDVWALETDFAATGVINAETFGHAVELKGTTLAVGSYAKSKAYVFSKTGSTWATRTQAALSAGGEITATSFYGWVVDVQGDRVIVGTNETATQKAFVFDKPGSAWGTSTINHSAVLKSALAGSGTSKFGSSVGIHGDLAVVGDSTYGTSTVFKRFGTSDWRSVQTLRSSDYGAGSLFGNAMINADRIVVSAAGKGKAYSFGVTPRDTQSIVASDAAANDSFGQAVDIGKEFAVVGAPTGEAAYVYVKDSQSFGWTQTQILTASDGAAGDGFGTAVAISGNTIVIGALTEQDNSSAIYGSVYVFTYNGDTWTQQAKIRASDKQHNDRFGCSVSIDGDTIAVGAWGEDTEGNNAGATYVYTGGGSSWTEQAILRPTALVSTDNFGKAVDVSGDILVSSAPYKDNVASDVGAILVFTRSAGTWTQQATLYAADKAASDQLGMSVRVEGETLVAGAPFDDDAGTSSGSAYIFEWDGSSWGTGTKIVASDAAASDIFAYSVDIFGGQVIASSSASDAIYSFKRVGGSWIEQEIIVGNASGENFGVNVALGYGNIIAGANLSDVEASNAGRATIVSSRVPVPTDGMALWLSTDQITGGGKLPEELRLNDNGTTGTGDDTYFFTKWLDLSFNGNHLVQATTSMQPKRVITSGGRNVAEFDGTDDVLTRATTLVSGTSKRTISMVVKSLVTPAATAIFSDGGGVSNGGRFIVTPEVSAEVTGGDRDFATSLGTTNYRLLTIVQNGSDVSNVDAYLDGVQLSQSAVSAMAINTASGAISIGAKEDGSSAFNGQITEIICYNRDLDRAERKWVEEYLVNNWLYPTYRKVSVQIPVFKTSQEITLSNWYLSAGDLNSPASSVVYTLKSVPSNGTLELSGTSLTTSPGSNTFTQADVNNGLVTFDHTGSSSDSHATFSFTVAGSLGGNGKLTEIVMVRIEDTPIHKLFGQVGKFRNNELYSTNGSPTGPVDTYAFSSIASNFYYINGEMSDAQFEYVAQDAPAPRNATMFGYCNSSTTNSNGNAVTAETNHRHKFGIMMTICGLLDEPTGITSSQTTFKIKQRDSYPIAIYDPTSYSLSNDVSPTTWQARDAVIFLRIKNELMKVTDWNSSTKVVTVVRGLDSAKTGALCTAGVAHSNNDPIFSPLYLKDANPIPTLSSTPSSNDKFGIRYIMDWSQPAGRDYHKWAADQELNYFSGIAATFTPAITDYRAAIWWDVFGSTNGNGDSCLGEYSPKWNTEYDDIASPDIVEDVYDTHMNATIQHIYQLKKIGEVRDYMQSTRGWTPFMSGNSYKTWQQRQYMVPQTLNNNNPMSGMFIEHFDADSREWLVRAMVDQDEDTASIPRDGNGNSQMSVLAKHLEGGSMEDPIRDKSERLGYAYFLLSINQNSQCMYGTSPQIWDPKVNSSGYWGGSYGQVHQQFFFPMGEPVESYTDLVDLDDPGAPSPGPTSITMLRVDKKVTFPSQYWPGTQVEYREYDNGVVFHNFSGYRTTIELPSYTGPSGTTSEYINTKTGKIVTSWVTDGYADTNIFLKLKN